jgi:hypothetical protein
MCFTRVGSRLTHKYLTWLKRLARDKHNSLLQTFVNYSRKKFYNIGPRFHIVKLMFVQANNNDLKNVLRWFFYFFFSVEQRSVQERPLAVQLAVRHLHG